MNSPDPTPEDDPAFLGTGWAFPPSFSGRGAAMVEGEEDIRQGLEILLSIAPGERIMRPDFGCDLQSLAFEPLDATQRTVVANLIESAILLREPHPRRRRLARWVSIFSRMKLKTAFPGQKNRAETSERRIQKNAES